MANLKFVNDTLYSLEREYGQRIMIVMKTHVNSNPETGHLDVGKKLLRPKGIILPVDHVRKFFQDVGFLRANSNFTYGGNIDFRDRTIVVRAKWLPRPFDTTLNHDILYKGKRYDSVKIEELHDGVAYIFTLKHTEGSLNYNLTDVRQEDNLEIQELAGTQ